MSRRSLALRPVISEKHEQTWSLIGQNFGTTPADIELVEAVAASAVGQATPEEVVNGSVVKSIYIEFNVSAEAITNTNIVHWKVIKVPAAVTGISPANTYNQTDKKFILKRGMEMLPKDVNTIIKRIFVLRIPPRLRRFGIGDKLRLLLETSASQTSNFCGIAIFKEFK